MQRSRLTTVLVGLGLGACGPEHGAAGELSNAPLDGSEPSGLGRAPKSARPSSTASSERQLASVPTQFCNATLQPRDDALLRTQSFLQAWNELAPPIRNPLAHNIPATEIDARMLLCGAEQCSLANAKLAEVTADYMIGVGVLIPSGDGMLVVPEIGPSHAIGSCSTSVELSVEHHGELVHVRSLQRENSYGPYSHHGHGDGYYAYVPQCTDTSTFRRDLVIDERRGSVELVIDQAQTADNQPPWVELEFSADSIVLRGCATTLALQWTG